MTTITQIPSPKVPVTDGELNLMSTQWYRYFYNQYTTSNGVTATITTAKLTGGGTNGSMTFVNGILTAQTAAT